MEPKVTVDHGRELDELTKFTKKFFDDLQEYNKDKEDTPKEAHILLLACDSTGGASFLCGDPDKLSHELLALVSRSRAFEEFIKELIQKIQLIILSNERESIAN